MILADVSCRRIDKMRVIVVKWNTDLVDEMDFRGFDFLKKEHGSSRSSGFSRI